VQVIYGNSKGADVSGLNVWERVVVVLLLLNLSKHLILLFSIQTKDFLVGQVEPNFKIMCTSLLKVFEDLACTVMRKLRTLV